MRKLLAFIGVAAALAVGVPATTSAGGWVVVSLDSAPAVHPGEDTEVGFTVLRHGVTPETSEDLAIVVTGNGDTYRFAARPAGAVGHHVATIRLPEAGDYTWLVEGQFVPADLGTLSVTEPSSGPSWTWAAVQWGSGSLALVLTVAAAVDLRRSRRERVTAATTA
jgi:hypothetical protein